MRRSDDRNAPRWRRPPRCLAWERVGAQPKTKECGTMSQPLPIDLSRFLATVNEFDLDTVLDSAQDQESATIGQQTADQDTDQTAAQGNEQSQDTDTTTVTEAGDGGNGGT